MFGKLGYNAFRATENNIDALSNVVENISNINSVGYKKSQTSFVETLNGEISKQETKDFSQGPLRRTGEVFDLALDGVGFFEVELLNGQRAYTRGGKFRLSSEGELVTDEGYKVIPEVEEAAKPVLEVNKDKKDELGLNIKVTTPKLTVSPDIVPEVLEDGTVNGINQSTGEKTKIGKINIIAFNNPGGLESIGKSYFLPTKASGMPIDLDAGSNGPSKIKQGYLELGNVDMANEFMRLSQMRNLLSAQFKLLKAIDKLYENVHYTISRSA